MREVLVSKGRMISRERGLGFVEPVVYEENKNYHIAKDEDFPEENEIFIVSGYEKIESKFDADDLFIVTATEDGSPSGSAKWTARGQSARENTDPTKYAIVITATVHPGEDNIVLIPFKPFSRTLFVRSSDDTIYGPFSTSRAQQVDDGYEIRLQPPTNEIPPFRLPSSHIAKIDPAILPSGSILELSFSTHAHSLTVLVIPDLAVLQPVAVAFEPIDWISEEDLIRWADRACENNGISRKDKNRLLSGVRDSREANPTRIQRLESIFTRLQMWEDTKSSILTNFIEKGSPLALQALNEWVDANREWVVLNLPENVKSAATIEKLRNTIRELEGDISTKSKEFEELKSATDSVKISRLTDAEKSNILNERLTYEQQLARPIHDRGSELYTTRMV